jgi:hypothetical protein
MSILGIMSEFAEAARRLAEICAMKVVTEDH